MFRKFYTDLPRELEEVFTLIEDKKWDQGREKLKAIKQDIKASHPTSLLVETANSTFKQALALEADIEKKSSAKTLTPTEESELTFKLKKLAADFNETYKQISIKASELKGSINFYEEFMKANAKKAHLLKRILQPLKDAEDNSKIQIIKIKKLAADLADMLGKLEEAIKPVINKPDQYVALFIQDIKFFKLKITWIAADFKYFEPRLAELLATAEICYAELEQEQKDLSTTARLAQLPPSPSIPPAPTPPTPVKSIALVAQISSSLTDDPVLQRTENMRHMQLR